MTRETILKAAFRAWGHDWYRSMSLSDVSARLGVTKPALYRHFRSKTQLIEALTADFFDRFVVRVRSITAETGKLERESERILAIADGLADYYARNKDDLIFTFSRLLGMPEPEKILALELASRGVSPALVTGWHDRSDERKTRLHFALATCFYSVSLFHVRRGDDAAPPDEAEIGTAVSDVHAFIARGLAFSEEAIRDVAYAELNRIARLSDAETATGNGLLPAVAAAVAEAGPWNASMELVARRSGLSKSGLYAHFKNREEMLKRLFSTEFERILTVMADRSARAVRPADRLYLAMAATTEYLLARQDVLVALDWVRAQRLRIDYALPETIASLFCFLTEAAEKGECVAPAGTIEETARWVLYLVVNMLMRTRLQAVTPLIVEKRLRSLHSCICSGIERW